MVDRLLLPLSRTAQALIAAERARAEDDDLKRRALARAKVTFEGDRVSRVTLRLVSMPEVSRTGARKPRVAGLLTAAFGLAALAAAGTQMVARNSATPADSVFAGADAAQQDAIELALLELARDGVAQGDYNAALGSIAQHERKFPHGELAEEREALRVRALSGAGQRQAAEAAASAFRQRYPRSGLLSQLREQQTR